MPSGFSIIIAGDRFDPKAFIEMEPRPTLPWQIVVPTKEHARRSSALELYDVLPGRFPLSIVDEFFLFLLDYREELSRALNAPGVDFRSLNIYDEPLGEITDFSFSNDQLRTIVDLGLDLCAENLATQPRKAGSRLLYRPNPSTTEPAKTDGDTPSA